jgi:hypothetical protein
MPPLPKIQNEKILYDAYVVRKLSTNEISASSEKLFGTLVSNAAVYQSLKRMGIPTRSIADGVQRAKCQLNIDKSFMTEQVIEWVDGFLLGDGRIEYTISNGIVKGARFSIGVLYEEFATYAISGFKDYHPSELKQSGKICERRPNLMWSSTTLSHPDIARQAERWYRGQGKKTRIPQDVRITPVSIMLWYLGDGSFHYNPNENNSLLRLATCSFLPEDIESILIPKLKALGIQCERTKCKNDIQILPESTGTFFNFIGRKSPIHCYDYKFDVPDWMFLHKLTDIIPDKKTRWRAMYHIKRGTIAHTTSPGGHYFLLNDEQKAQLIAKMATHVEQAEVKDNSALVRLSSVAKSQTERYNARWIARKCGIAINKSGCILKDSLPVVEQEVKAIGEEWAVPQEVIDAEFIKVRQGGFPYYDFDDATATKLYANLKDFEPCQDANGVWFWDGKGTELATWFHPHIFECKKIGKTSPVEFFNSDPDLRRGIYKLLCLYGRVDRSLVREMCRNEQMPNRVNNFSPRVAKAIVRLLFGAKPGIKVLDPCAGFSGRQIGCASTGTVSRYVGIDLSPKTCEGLKLAVAFLERMKSEMASAIIEGNCLEVMKTLPGEFDLVLTSPPFAGREEYVGVPVERSIGVWLESFFKPFLALCRGRMADGGKLALYLGETVGRKTKGNMLPDYARELASSSGLVETDPLIFKIAQANRSRPDRSSRLTSIQVWHKA